MSFTFWVNSPAPPDYASVLAELGIDDVRPDPNEDHHPEDGPWPDSQVHHFYQHGRSTRGCEIEYQANTFSVRINTLASPEDYQLGMRFVEVVAEFAGKKIHTEDDVTITRRELRSKYDRSWIDHTNSTGIKVIAQTIHEEGPDACSEIQLAGCFRPFHIGPRVWNELDTGGSTGQLLERFMDRFRTVQYIHDDDRYYPANVMSMKKNESEDEILFAVYGPGIDYLLPGVPYLLVMDAANEQIARVDSKLLPQLAPGRWQWLDEKQTLVERTPENEWPAVFALAQRHKVD